MTRHRIMIRKWKYDEVGEDTRKQKTTSRDTDEISAPLEHLEEFRNSDYKIAEHLPDIYGWKVVDPTGEKIGLIEDFLFDKNKEKIRYVVVDLKEVELVKEEKKILIPIGKAQLKQEDEKVVVLKKLSSEKLSDLPVYGNVKSLAIEDEKRILNFFSNTNGGEIDYTKQKFYNRDDFDENIFFGAG